MSLEFIVALSWLWVPALIIYLLYKMGNSSDTGKSSSLAQRDQAWRDYIASYIPYAKNSKEKKLLAALLEGKRADEYFGQPYKPAVADAQARAGVRNYSGDDIAAKNVAVAEAASPETITADPRRSEPIDNTLLLLYFGAFLLVTSVGLFVAISDLEGLIRTMIVGITAAILYIGGQWLYAANKKLAPAGITFVGAGMVIAPLTGIAWYNLVSNNSNAGLVWLFTSLACAALYLHAYKTLNNDFVSYLLIGSYVSIIESSVLTLELPSYGYIWGLIAVGVGLAIRNRLRGRSTPFDSASASSAALLVPLSVLGSLALAPQFGSLQLSVTLLLTSLYYGLCAWWQPDGRSMFSALAQVSAVASLASTVFAVWDSVLAIGICLSVIALDYGLLITLIRPAVASCHSVVPIASVASLLAILLSISDPWAFVGALGVSIFLGATIWLRQQSDEALQVAGLLMIILPFAVGQYALKSNFGSHQQLLLCAVGSLILLAVAVLTSRATKFRSYQNSAHVLYIISIVAVLAIASANGFSELCLTTVLAVGSFILLRHLSKDSDWLIISGLVVFVPLLHAFATFGIDDARFSAAVAVALVWNVGLSLATRHSLVRWLVVSLILIAPFALGGGGLGINWAEAGYAGGYLIAMAACVAARAIARGKILLSAKVPIASYYAEASHAYVSGYVLAGSIALLVSLADANSRLVTSLVLTALGVATVLVARIERNNRILALLPLITQALLFSTVRPDMGDPETAGAIAFTSTLLAVASYAFAYILSHEAANSPAAQDVRVVSVFAAYIGPMLSITQSDDVSVLFPTSLFIAGLLTFVYNHTARQSHKELSLGVSIAAIHWLVILAGITNLHLHTHLLALFLALFALWRYSLNDQMSGGNYVKALFFIVTVPLALQALSGESGEMYGLILIAEQIFFMVAGAMLNQRFLLRWGLWTALAAVLFQLRGLGWAFLSLLAIIIIGVAVYRLQKHSDT